MGKKPAEVAFWLAREVDSPEAGEILISSTNSRTLAILVPPEREAGKPVVTSVQATAWAALRALNIRDRIGSFGRFPNSISMETRVVSKI